MSTDYSNSETGREYDGDNHSDWTGWAVAVLGLWVLITPFFLGGVTAPETTASSGIFAGSAWLLWSNVVSGIIITALGAYDGYSN
jgi:hypothetical protein